MIFTPQTWHTIDLLIFKELIFEVNEDNVLGLKKKQGHLQWNSQQKESIFRQSVWREQKNIFIGVLKPFFDDGHIPSNAME